MRNTQDSTNHGHAKEIEMDANNGSVAEAQFHTDDNGETPTAMRSGPSWEAFLKHYRILAVRERDDGVREVESESGQTYEVSTTTHIARDSGSMYFRPHCTCPARRTCRHIKAVYDMLMSESLAAEDYTGVEVFERWEM